MVKNDIFESMIKLCSANYAPSGAQNRAKLSVKIVCKGKRVTLVYLYHVNRCGHHRKLSIAKMDFVQVCGLSLNFYNNTLRKFYKFCDSRET